MEAAGATPGAAGRDIWLGVGATRKPLITFEFNRLKFVALLPSVLLCHNNDWGFPAGKADARAGGGDKQAFSSRSDQTIAL
jgi:hypothetical protein